MCFCLEAYLKNISFDNSGKVESSVMSLALNRPTFVIIRTGGVGRFQNYSYKRKESSVHDELYLLS